MGRRSREIADKRISDLPLASLIQSADLFVLEQSGTAKRLTGQTLLNWLTAAADGHGGIQSISIVDSGTPRDGAMHTATIHYADTTTSTFTYYDGLKGNTGDSCYVHIKYAADMPTSDADMGNTPDNYIGLYIGTSATAPVHYGSYEWFKWKGDTGATGTPAAIVSQSVGYMVSSSGTTVPEGSWTSNIPTVPAGYYLWCRTRVVYNDQNNTTVTSYSVSRNGIDGQGAVSSVNNVSPDANGNIALTASDISCSDNDSVQTHITALESSVSDLQTYEIRHISGVINASNRSFSYGFITADHRVINVELGTPTAITSALQWTTSAGDVTFSCQFVQNGQTTIDFDIVRVVTP